MEGLEVAVVENNTFELHHAATGYLNVDIVVELELNGFLFVEAKFLAKKCSYVFNVLEKIQVAGEL